MPVKKPQSGSLTDHLQRLPVGDTIVVLNTDRNVTTSALRAGVKVTTSKVYVVCPANNSLLNAVLVCRWE